MSVIFVLVIYLNIFIKWDYPQVGFLSDGYETANINTSRNLKSSIIFVMNNLSGKFYLTFFLFQDYP